MEKRCNGSHKNLAVVLGLGVGAAAVLSISNQAQALPSYARHYKVECATCHTHFPERNEFGEAFERNGFVWPSTKMPVKSEKGNEALMLSGIPDDVPLSAYARVTSTYKAENTDDGVGPTFDYGNGGNFEFFASGNFKEKVGYWAQANFDNTGASTSQVWMQFNDPGNIPMYIKLGTMSSTLSLLTSTAAQGYALNNQATYGGATPNSSQPSVEISKNIAGKVYAAAGLQNNKGNDNSVNNSVAPYGKLLWRVMGTDLYGNQPKVDLSAKESFTDYLTLTVAGWGITGSQHEFLNLGEDNEYDRYGVDTEAVYKAWRLRLSSTWGEEENPYSSSAQRLESKDLDSYHALVEYMINSDWLVGAAYNHLDLDELTPTSRRYPQDNTAFTVSYLFYQNVRLRAAYVHDTYSPTAANYEDGNRDTLTFNAYFSM